MQYIKLHRTEADALGFKEFGVRGGKVIGVAEVDSECYKDDSVRLLKENGYAILHYRDALKYMVTEESLMRHLVRIGAYFYVEGCDSNIKELFLPEFKTTSFVEREFFTVHDDGSITRGRGPVERTARVFRDSGAEALVVEAVSKTEAITDWKGDGAMIYLSGDDNFDASCIVGIRMLHEELRHAAGDT